MFGRTTLAIVARTNDALNGSMHHRTYDGRAFRSLNFLDEHSRECPLSSIASQSPAGQRDDPGESEAGFDRSHRRVDGLVHSSRRA